MESNNNSSSTNLKGMNVGCYDGLSKEIYTQEGIDYDAKHQEFTKNYLDKLVHPEKYKTDKTSPIPNIKHYIHFFSPNNLKNIDQISIDKTILTIAGLNNLEKGFTHFYWTNNPDKLPVEITSLPNVIIKNIEELEGQILWDDIKKLIQESDTNERALSGASDLARYTILNIHGGCYTDEDYHLLDPEKYFNLSQNYAFVGGKEFDKEMSYMGNSFIASTPKHPVIETAISQIYRNLHSDISSLPEYLQHPCAKFNARMYSTGPALLTLAFYKAANAETDFMAINGNIFFNENYIKYITPNTICSKPNEPVDPINNINGTLVNTIGADTWCHPWPNEYFEYTYYPEYLNRYLYESVLSNSIEKIKYYISLGADLNISYKGNAPLKLAVENQNIDAIKLLVASNAIVTEEIKQQAVDTKNPSIVRALFKDSKIDSLGCYGNNIEYIFAQEGFNYYEEDKKLTEHYKEVIKKVDYYIENNKSPIPLKTTQVYLSSATSPKPIDDLSLNNTISSLELLNEASDEWQHYFWTNNIESLPESIKNIKNIKIRLIDEFKDHPLWNNIQSLLKEAESKKYLYAMVADIIRLLAMNIEGGLYRDLDNKIHQDPDPEHKLARVETLITWMKAFNFIGAREHNKDISFVGNAFFAAIPNHEIITTTINYIERNLNSEKLSLPEYLQYPCNVGIKVVYDTGSPTLTSSYYGKGNQNGNVDVVFPTNVFFNVEYGRLLAPKSRCHQLAGDAKLDNIINGELIKSISSDPNCGSWHTLDPIHYPHLIDVRLFHASETGNIDLLEDLLKFNPDINLLNNNGVNPLGIASNKGHIEIVKKLLELKANLEVLSAGHTPLYWAIQEGHYEIAKLLIAAGANVNAPQANRASILYLSCNKKALEIIKILLQQGADTKAKTGNLTPEEFAKTNNFTEITQIFLDHRLFVAAHIGNDEEVKKLLDLGANVNSYNILNATPLYTAAKENHLSTVKLLLKHKANVNLATIKGTTALYASVEAGNTKVTEALLEAGADTEIKTGEISPLVAAAHSENIEDVALLLKYNAQIISNETYTALNIFAKKQIHTEKGDIIYNMVLNHYLNSKEIIEPTFEVVIARYNEDINWAIKEFGKQSNIKVTIYNKGADDIDLNELPQHFNVKKLPNVGRESHTYFHHIITNYNNLADIVLFLQGHPYEHPVHLPLRTYKDQPKSRCKNIIAKCQDGQPTLLDKSNDLEMQVKTKYTGQTFPYNLVQFVQQLINPNINPNFAVDSVNGAQFAVKKENILSHSIGFYTKLINVLKNSLNPLEGFFYERLYDLIFDPDIELNIFLASYMGDIKTVAKLLDKGINTLEQRFDLGLTALHAAASGNHLDIIKFLLEKGASIDLLSNQHLSPLFIAVNNNRTEAAKILLENGANPNIAVNGESIVDLAKRLNNLEMIEVFKNSIPSTSIDLELVSSILEGNVKKLEFLIDSGANPNFIFNKSGDTLLHLAIKLENLEIINLLLDKGAKVYSDKFMDPLSYAERLELPDIHKLLLEKYHADLKEKNANSPKCSYNPDNNDFEVVVTRYNEDVSWLRDEFPCDKVTVYNKGEDSLSLLPQHYELKTINVEFSEGIILKYIVDHYYHLPNRVLFLQGNPYDAYVYMELARFKDNLPSLCKNIIGKCEPNHNFKAESIALQQFDFLTGINGKYKDFNYQENDLLSYAKHYLNTEIPDFHAICYASQFAVEKEVILRHPIEYYQTLSDSINYSKKTVEAFYFERIMDLVFANPIDYAKYSPSGNCAIELPW